MKAIYEDVNTASGVNTSSTKSFWTTHGRELLIVCAFILSGIFFVFSYPTLPIVKNLSSISKITSDSTQYIKLKLSEKINMQEVVEKSMSYSYGDTQLGFYLKDLEFFEMNSKLDAEVKILGSLPRSLARKAKKYLRAVLKIAQNHQVDPIWVLSVMWTESSFDYSAKSWAGARGLMQIMPETRKFIYKRYKRGGNTLMVDADDFNINEYFPYRVDNKSKKVHEKKLVNIELGVIYLKTLLESFNDHVHATVAYNMGPGWTRGRLRRKLPVGQKNKYLDKVQAAYLMISKKI